MLQAMTCISQLFCFSKVISPFQLTILRSAGCLADTLDLFGHYLFPDVFPDLTPKFKSIRR